jgi:pectin methylesterase-like acyl-CoA thioesterase
MKKNFNKIPFLLLAFFILFSLTGIGTAAEIIVQPGNSIQAAVNNSTSGDVIIVMPGTYIENVEVPTGNLTIRSESGNSDNTTIKVTIQPTQNQLIDIDFDITDKCD